MRTMLMNATSPINCRDAIIYQGKALKVWEEKMKLSNWEIACGYSSRLWWFDGNRQKAESFAGRRPLKF